MAKFCSFCGSAVEPTERTCKGCGAPNDAYAPQVAGVRAGSSGPWRFERSVSGCGDRLVGSMGMGRPGVKPGLVEMMIRGAFLDGATYRQAAADPDGNGSAILALIIPAVAGLIGGLLVAPRYLYFGNRITVLVLSVIIGLVATLAALGVMAAASGAVVGRKLDFGQMLRGLAYAQSPGVAAIIPVLGGLLGLWRIVTTLVAVREISGADTGRSIGLLLIGLGTSIVIGIVMSPILFSALDLRAW